MVVPVNINAIPSQLTGELLPGVFMQTDLTELPVDEAFGCESHDDGNAARVTGITGTGYIKPDITYMRVSGDRLFFIPSTPRQERRAKARETMPRLGNPAADTQGILYYDGHHHGTVGRHERAYNQARSVRRAWKMRSDNAEKRQTDVTFFLRPLMHGLSGMVERVDSINPENKEASLSDLKKIRDGLRVREVTARRLEVLRLGQYVAQRRGNIWLAVNTSRMSDMPFFGLAVPLAGLAMRPLNEQYSHKRAIRQVLPVVIGQSLRPYLLNNAGQSIFTLRENSRGI